MANSGDCLGFRAGEPTESQVLSNYWRLKRYGIDSSVEHWEFLEPVVV